MDRLPDQLKPGLRLVFVGTAASARSASLFYRKPTGAIALGRQSEQDDFPTAFVLASPSGAASGAWTLQPWQDLAEHVASG